MNRSNKIKSTADEMLGGLNATQGSLYQILRQKKKRPSVSRQAIALACALALLAATAVVLSTLPLRPALTITAAGGSTLNAHQTASNLMRGSLRLVSGERPQYQGLWASGKDGNFPMVAVNGQIYRLMKKPTAVDEALLQNALGTVDTVTDEPALTDLSSGIVSNVVASGDTVYAPQQMQGAVVLAKVDGVCRAFQRSSFSGYAIQGGESLPATLGSASIVAMQLSDVGTITDPAQLQTLQDLLSQAQFQKAGIKSSKQALLIQFDNDFVLQLLIRDDALMGCGTWNAPGFVAAFTSMVQD